MAITAAAAPTAQDDDTLSSPQYWAARFLEACRVWDTEFDYEKAPEEQGDVVNAAMAGHELALTRLANDRADTPCDIGTKMAVALELLPSDDDDGPLRALLASALLDLKLMELRDVGAASAGQRARHARPAAGRGGPEDAMTAVA